MDKKTEAVVAVAEEAVKKNLLTPKRLAAVGVAVVVGVGVTLYLKSRKKNEETVEVPEPARFAESKKAPNEKK